MRICLVTTHHISYNPRVLKEADTLTEAGHEVKVLAVNNLHTLKEKDERLMASRKWQLSTINYRRSSQQEVFLWLWTGIRKEAFERLQSYTCHYGIAERAHGREHVELRRLALRNPADLYIAHHVEALGAAYAASRKHNAFFAFDAEDFHSGELPDGRDAKQRARIEYLESKYLPLCDYITAASDGIADALAEKYNISRPEVILNVFPLEPLPSEHQERRTENQEPVIKLYWYSQVIGPGRGLEETILALNKLYWPCQLHLRGQLLDDFDTTLRGMAHESGSKGKLFLHQPAPPEDLVHLAAEHDIGLALETGESRNRLLCVTNKLFVYMLAGLAIVATDTPGQATIMNQAPGAGMTCHMRNPESLAEAIGKLISNPAKLAEGRKASRQAAEQRFNWDIEKKKLVRIVEKLQN